MNSKIPKLGKAITNANNLFTHNWGLWLLPVVVALASLFFQAIDWVELLRYSRDDIHEGQWFSILTGNLVHLSWGHLLLNLAGLAMVWWFFVKDVKPWEWLFVFVISGLFVTVGLYVLNPELIWYVGLSGLLHGLFIAGGIRIWAGEKGFASILLLGLIGKLAYEQGFGSLPGTSEMSGGPVVVDAHLYGAIGGAVAMLILTASRFIVKLRG